MSLINYCLLSLSKSVNAVLIKIFVVSIKTAENKQK